MYNNPYSNFLQQTSPQHSQGYHYQQNQSQGYQAQSMPQQNQVFAQRYEVTEVNGMAGAQAFQMLPNSRTILMDANEPIVYIKITDGAGYPTISPYRLSPVQQEQKQAEIDFENRLQAVESRLEGIMHEQITHTAGLPTAPSEPTTGTPRRGKSVPSNTTAGTTA